MINLRLKKNDEWHQLDLQPGTVITGETGYDLLSIELDSAEKTYPFDLPATGTNIRFFGAPQELKSFKPMFREYEAILAHGANVYKQGYFKLTEVNAGYKGFYKAPASTVVKVKDELIGKVINSSMARIYGWRDSVDKTQPKDAIVFPTLFMPDFYTNEKNKHTEFLGLAAKHTDQNAEERLGLINYRFAEQNDSRGQAILPVPRLLFVIDELIKALGFTVQYNFSTEHFYKILLLTHQAADRPWRVNEMIGELHDRVHYYHLYADILYGESLPAITVSDFLKALRINFGLRFTWEANGICQLDLVRDLVLSKDSIDISAYANPKPVRKEETNKFRFGFAKSGSGKDADSISDYRLKPAVLLFANLPAADELSANHCRLVLTQNKYYVVKYDGMQWQWVPTATVFHSELTGDKELSSPLSPVEMVDNATVIMYAELPADGSTYPPTEKENIPVVDFALDKFNLDRALAFTVSDGLPWVDQIRIVDPPEFKTDWMPLEHTTFLSKSWYHFKAQTEDGYGIRRPYNATGVKLEIKKRFGFQVPFIPESGSSNAYNIKNNAFPAYMAFYHGKTPRLDKEGFTELASSSNYDSKGNRLAPFALRFNGDDGLVDYFWSDALALLQDTETVQYTALLPVSFLRNYNGRKKLRIKDAVYLPKQIKYRLSSDALIECSLELRQLRYNSDLLPGDLSDGVLWAADDTAVVSDNDGTFILAQN
jgi:hypothetical protein